jgi:hypothetical protein
MHKFSTFGANTSHEQIWTHKTHHGQNLGEATTFPLYNILYISSRGPHPNGILSRNSQVGVSEFPQLGFPQLWGPILLRANLRLQ